MKRLAIFAHYDDRGEVKRHILNNLRALREVCEEVWFVSTAGLSESELDKVRPLCERVWVRENVGYDFGMWQDAFRRYDLSSWDELVLVNSSVFGPIWPLSDAFSRMAARDVDFWGMTDCTHFGWHIQSYFLVFRERLFHSPVLRDFFLNLDLSGTKLEVIDKCEVALSPYLIREGFRGEAFVPCAEIPRSRSLRIRRPDFNPMMATPMALLARWMPYVKVELFRDNPRRMSLDCIYEVMDVSGYDRSLVEFDARAPLTPRKSWLARIKG